MFTIVGLWLIVTAMGGIVEIETGTLWDKLRPNLNLLIPLKLWILGIIILLIFVFGFCIGVAVNIRFGSKIRDRTIDKASSGIITDDFLLEPDNIPFGELAAKLIAVRDGKMASSEFSQFVLKGLNQKRIGLRDAKRILLEVNKGVKMTQSGRYVIVEKSKRR